MKSLGMQSCFQTMCTPWSRESSWNEMYKLLKEDIHIEDVKQPTLETIEQG